MTLKDYILPLSYFPLHLISSASRLINPKHTPRLRVLLYHDVHPNEQELFANQLRWLSRSWHFITPNEFSSVLSGEYIVKKDSLLLTFDDGFVSNRQIADAVLNPMGIKALFFVVTEFISISNIFEAYKFVSKNICPSTPLNKIPPHLYNMTWGDLEHLLQSGHSIGAHTANHSRLSDLAVDAYKDEIIESADLLEKNLSCQVRHFAFTFGDIASINPMVLSVARDRFDYIYTGLRGINSSHVPPWAIRRDSIKPSDSFGMVGAFLEGAVDWRYKHSLKKYESWVNIA